MAPALKSGGLFVYSTSANPETPEMHEVLPDHINDAIEGFDTSGVLVKSLEKGDVLKVCTMEGTYKFTIIDPQKAIVKAEGGGFKKGGEAVVFLGSNFGGTMLKMHWAGPDSRVEAGDLILPWTTDLMLNDKVVLSSKGVQ